MDTNSRVAAASVIGARHQRAGRNGQDAAVALVSGDVAVAVVCDGCSSGASSEVGARLGARLFAEALAAKLAAGACVRERSTWEAVRAEVARTLAGVVGGAIVDAEAVHATLLFTIVAAAVTGEGAAVWVLGDGTYSCDGRVEILGPFPDNQPPYLAYDLIGSPQPAHFAVLEDVRRIVVATDGVADLDHDLGVFGAAALVAHPDLLRRRLVQLAQHDERIDWAERRVIRTPAMLQDDCAIAIIERGDA